MSSSEYPVLMSHKVVLLKDKERHMLCFYLVALMLKFPSPLSHW
jgi:hypothetical protein